MQTVTQPVLFVKETALLCASGLRNAPSHFSTVLFVLSSASLPTSTASCAPCPPATAAKLSHNCPTWHVLLDVRTKL